MVLHARDVLLDDRIEAGFDEAAILAEMEGLAAEAGDWRNHLPYAAALTYYTDPRIMLDYEEHVDACKYCQRLLGALHPNDRILQNLEAARAETEKEDYPAPVHSAGTAAFSSPWAIAASLIGGLAIGWLALPSLTGYVPADNGQASMAFESFFENPVELSQLERTDNTLAKFQAARIYLATEHAEQAYQQLGQGLAYANVDDRIVEAVARAPVLKGDASESLSEAAAGLKRLEQKPSLTTGEMFRLFQLRAQLGQHEAALDSLRSYLAYRDGSDVVLADLEKAGLVEQK